MITYTFDPYDLETARFGISPLNEACLSLRLLRRPERYPHLAAFHELVRARLPRLDHDLLDALVAADESTPDFLNPRPDVHLSDLADELRVVATLSDREVDRDLEEIHPDGRPAALRGPASQVRERICAGLEGYWTHCVEPWWPRMLATLRSDITYRAVLGARSGQQRMLDSLSTSITWAPGALHGWNPNGPAYEASVNGRGLVLIPTHFTPWMSYPFSPRFPPYLLYPARGRGNTFAPGPGEVSEAVARIIGRARAQVLAEVAQPISSTDVAARLGVTVTGANQHLRALRDAGFLHATRTGRSVLYERTPLAEGLLDQNRRP